MKNRFSIRTQLTLLFIAILIVIMGISWVVLPKYLNNLIDDTFFETIEKRPFSNGESAISNDMYAVQHLLIDANGMVLTQREDFAKQMFFSEVLLDKFSIIAVSQEKSKGMYIINLDRVKVYCVVYKINQVYRVSYMYDILGSAFQKKIVISNFILLSFMALFGLIGIFIFSQVLINRIIRINDKVKIIADGNWNDPVPMQQMDEVGHLAESIEYLRVKLLEQDQYKNEMFQSLSHELKTPIMIINTYAQGMVDGVYPEGNLIKTAELIVDESQMLDEKVQKILLLNKIKYLKQHNERFDMVDMQSIVEKLVRRFEHVSSVAFIAHLMPSEFYGDEDKWSTALENIISNNLRYAKTRLEITLTQDQIIIFNDGEPIEFEDPNEVFQVFKSGQNGKNGIGLEISKSIINLFECVVKVENIINGVQFIISK